VKLALFVGEYLKANFNGTKAAIAVGYSPASARVKASELLALPEVIQQIEVVMKARAERLQIDTDTIVWRMYTIATADPRELIGLHRCCCRYCWSANNHFQRTAHEMEAARQKHALKESEATAGNKAIAPFDEKGGIGYNLTYDPNPACPECHGRGVERIVTKDTRDLSTNARLLYAGVKATQSGVEIKMHDQAAMLLGVAKHLGMFTKTVMVRGDLNQHQDISAYLLNGLDDERVCFTPATNL
jgi:hypothetical protein